MAAETKPLVRPDALRSRLDTFQLPPAAAAGRQCFSRWAALLASEGAGMKETELRDEFLYDVFRDLLGYVTPAQAPAAYTLRKEVLVKVDSTFADAALGRFSAGGNDFVVVIEGKGLGDKLDKPYGNRKRTAVEQAMLYAVQLQIDWYMVTNLKETRLYHKGHDTFTRETFETARLPCGRHA